MNLAEGTIQTVSSKMVMAAALKSSAVNSKPGDFFVVVVALVAVVAVAVVELVIEEVVVMTVVVSVSSLIPSPGQS